MPPGRAAQPLQQLPGFDNAAPGQTSAMTGPTHPAQAHDLTAARHTPISS